MAALPRETQWILVTILVLLAGLFLVGQQASSFASVRPKPEVVTSEHAAAQSCPFADFDIFIVVQASEYPLLGYLLNSLEDFFPCRGLIHILTDTASLPKIFPWLTLPNDGISLRLHGADVPLEIASLRTEQINEYLLLNADHYLRQEADFVLFFKPESVLTFPVTCASLFDSSNHIYHVAFEPRSDWGFSSICQALFQNSKCDRDFLSTMPFVMPKESLGKLRDYIGHALGMSEFRLAYQKLLELQGSNDEFSAIRLMGEYMRSMHSNLVHQVYCPPSEGHDLSKFVDFLASNSESESCTNYVPPAIYLAQRAAARTKLQHFVNLIEKNNSIEFILNKNKGEFSKFSKFYGVKYLDIIRMAIHDGWCFDRHLNFGVFEPNCRFDSLISINWNSNIYGDDHQPDINVVKSTFKRDSPGPVCSTRTGLR